MTDFAAISRTNAALTRLGRRGSDVPEQPRWLVTTAYVNTDGTTSASRTSEVDMHPSRYFERLQDELARDKAVGQMHWVDRYVLIFAIPVH